VVSTGTTDTVATMTSDRSENVSEADAYSDAESRARGSGGTSNNAIHNMVVGALRDRGGANGWLVDVGCGTGAFWEAIGSQVQRYTGVDLVDYETNTFEQLTADLNKDPLPFDDNSVDTVTAIEVIEHVENPRRFMRELSRIVKPGGLVAVTTPNQMSILSIGTLIVKGHYSAFQDSSYPAHITALLERDLTRIATESGLVDVTFHYSLQGRIPATPFHFPKWFARTLPRRWSDNIGILAKKPV
jgi:2-polyprenyl-3-methyl-5-hydroxy-6-metoxy-1,4-benzoquinol methylase